MSLVTVLAADRPMPLLEPENGFGIAPFHYYASALEQMELEMKSFLYELHLSARQESVDALRQYLAAHGCPGETVELWNVWLGPPPEFGAFNRYSTLAELDLLTVYHLLKDDPICLTVTL